MRRRYAYFIFMILLSQILLVFIGYSNPDKAPSNAVAGRYAIYDDNYWVARTITVEEFEGEGYDIPDEYSSDLKIQVNYSRSDYQFTLKIESLSYPTVTLRNIEGEHDLNVIAYGIEDNTEGETIATYSSRQPANERTWEDEDPNYGVLIDPSQLVIGNQFSYEAELIFTVDRTEILETHWGKNETYVLEALLDIGGVQLTKWFMWCDATSGIILKQIIIQENPVRVSREEMRLIETGIRIEVTDGEEIYEIPIVTNSIINEVAFDPAASKLTITVEGSTGTEGTLNVTVPKEIVPTEHAFEVVVDDKKVDSLVYEDKNNYYIYVEYQHSSHIITISFISSPQETGIPGFTVGSILLGIILCVFILSKLR